MLIWLRAQKPAQRVWQALGYASWLECTKAEFGDSERHLYRQLAAAEIERRIDPGVKIGTLPEKQLRPLARLTPLEQPMAWDEANARTDGKPTACHTCHTKKKEPPGRSGRTVLCARKIEQRSMGINRRRCSIAVLCGKRL